MDPVKQPMLSSLICTKRNRIDLEMLTHPLRSVVPSTSMESTILSSLSNQELRQRLSTMNNSAPGKDKVEYRHLRLVDPHSSILRVIFNRCLLAQRIPRKWKESSTILIFKKGPSEDPANHRPIALLSCLYKLLMSLLASRITQIAI